MRLRKRMLDDLDQDIRNHLDSETQDNIDRGMSPEKARHAALVKFGNVTRVREQTREVWTLMWFEQLNQDIRYAFRALGRSPAFALTALSCLALGVGANTAIFSVLDSLLLRSLPVTEPARLVQLEQRYESKGYNFFSYPTYLRLRDSDKVFSSLFAWSIRPMNVRFGAPPEPVSGMYVTGNYFSGLGIPAVIGRTISSEDDRTGSAPVAVLSYNSWKTRFGGDPEVIGHTVTVEQLPVTIVGVTPSWFFGAEVGRSFDLAVPISLQPQIDTDQPFLDRVDAQWIRTMARLAPGVSAQQARAQCAILWPQIVAEVDPKGTNGLHAFGLQLEPANTGLSQLREKFSRPLFVLLVIAGFVLVIACGNVANLLLARAAARQREIAVRFALGASRLRVVRQLLIESMVLSALGSAAGLLLALWGARALVSLLSAGAAKQVTLHLGLDWRILLFTAAAGMLCAVLFGLAPAFRGSGLESTLRSSRRTVGGSRRNVSKTLIVVQLALSMTLLLGAGLFVRSFQKILAVDAGFHRERVLLVHIRPGRSGYKDRALAALYDQLLARLRAIPGVSAVSLSNYPPLTGGGGTFFSVDNVLVDGRPVPAGTSGNVWLNSIGSHFFDVLETPLLAGRDFSNREAAGATDTVIVSEALARALFPGQSAVGHSIQIQRGAPARIVGVARTMKYETLQETPHLIVFEPYAQHIDKVGSVYIEVRGQGDLSALTGMIRGPISDIAPRVPFETLTLTDWVNQFLTDDRLTASLAGAFGLLAILLAAVGLYGVMAYSVTQRTSEIGVRLALGAGRGKILRLILREAAILVIIGLSVGLPLSIAFARLLGSMLFEIKPWNPAVLLSAVALLSGTALAAAYFPARRAAKVDPMTALRYE